MTRSGEPIRVLLLSPVGVVGGAERVLLDLIRSTRGRVRCGLVAMDGGPLADAAHAAGAERIYVCRWPAGAAGAGESGIAGGGVVGGIARAAGAGLATLASLPALAETAGEVDRAIESFAPHVVHSNGLKTHLLSPWLHLRGAAMVWHLHDLLAGRALARRILPRAAKAAGRMIAVSRAVADDAAAVLGRGAGRIETIHNGVDVERFAPPTPADAADAAARLDALAGFVPTDHGEVVRVGLVATFARWKGQDVFARAVAALPPGVRRAARFYIVGGPIYRTAGSQWSEGELKALASGLGVGGEVGFTGFLDDPAVAYLGLDVVVQASTRPEPFGLTIAESMACGRATIASRAGGAAELFQDGVEAIGVAPGDVAGLAGALGRVITDADLRRRLGSAGRAAAVQRLGLRRFADEICSCYFRLLHDLR